MNNQRLICQNCRTPLDTRGGYPCCDTPNLSGNPTPANPVRLPVLPRGEWDTIRRPEYLIKGVINRGSVVHLVGGWGTYKSFTMLDMAAHIGGGFPWHGRRVRQGSVMYVCAEGVTGWMPRVMAWEQHHGRRMEGVSLIPQAVQLNDDSECMLLAQAIGEHRPDVLVLDTQAQCTVGVEENSNTDMMRIMRKVTSIATNSGAAVILVHHAGHDGERGRGASAVAGAMDTILMTKVTGDKGTPEHSVTLTATKQKDGEGGPLVTFQPTPVILRGVADEDGDPVSSVVMLPLGPAEDPARITARALITAGITEPMGRDKLTAAAKAAGVPFPTNNAAGSAIVRAHKTLLLEAADDRGASLDMDPLPL